MIDDLREFVAPDVDGAVDKAAKHFGVPSDRLAFAVLSGRMPISGVGTRVLLLASVREELAQVGPAGEFLVGVLERMQVGGPIKVEQSEEEGQILLRIRGGRTRELTRRDPKVQGALAHLATRAAQRVDPEATVRIDVGGDPHAGGDPHVGGDTGGEERLEELARSKARQAQAQGREVLLAPMSGRERWIVHNTLKSVPGIQTESVGEGRHKRIKILPI